MILAVDMETTGLNLGTCSILEIAVVVLDDDLNEIDRYEQVIETDEELLENMNEFCTKTHTETGLISDVLENGIPMYQVKQELLEFFIKNGLDDPEVKPPLLGSSIFFDRTLFKRDFGSLNARISYRNIDVSSLTELVQRWCPSQEYEGVEGDHRAMSDIQRSIDIARHYRDVLFSRS